MKKILFMLIALGLVAMACQLTTGSGQNANTPTAVLSVPTAAAATVESPIMVSPVAQASSPTPPSSVTSPTPMDPAEGETIQPTRPAGQSLATPTPCQVRAEWPEYIVQAGDTLFQIAQRAGSSVDELVAANCFTDRNQIFVGQSLRVPNTLDDSQAYPTRISDGTELNTYPADACFSPPFFSDLGISIGERWRVSTDLEVLTAYDGPHGNNPAGLLQRGEHFWVQEGPVCFTQRIGSSHMAFRRWRVESEQRALEGWIDDRDAFTEFTTVEPRPIVRRFEASPQVVNTGDPITISWELDGANEAYIFSYHGLHRFASDRVGEAPFLPPSGTITATAPTPLTSIQYSIGFGPEDPNHWARVTIRCTERFFADAGDVRACPLGPVETIDAAYQPFERGFMLWRRDTYVDKIWVMRQDSGGSLVFADYWEGEEITYAETPPAGLFQPVRGFGKVWVENEWVKEALGWATAPEQAYRMELQKTQTSYNSFHFVLTLPDGQPLQATVSMGNYLDWAYTSRR